MIYAKTPIGHQAFKNRASQFTSKLRIAYLLIDGVRSRADVLAATAGMGVLESDLEQLERLGFVEQVAATTTEEKRATLSPAQQSVLFTAAAQRATAITASLGLRGFRLNLAVETAKSLDDLHVLMPQFEQALGSNTTALQALAAILNHD